MMPTVAIVGRPNVGKSALFNRLSGKQISLVYDQPGVTRDRLSVTCDWEDHPVQLIDTGGVGLEDESGFESAIQREVDIAIETAEAILFVVDGRAGVHHLDEEIAERLRRTDKPVFLVVNKMDTDKQDNWENEFYGLGFEQVFPVSAAHGRGVWNLKEAVLKDCEAGEKTAQEGERDTRVAIVGRPNAGKSSLINALTNEDRVIVSPIAGTTRDAVDVSFQLEGRSYCLIDTAGMRRRSRVRDPLEQVMASRTAHSINRADLVVLVIDALIGMAEQEKKIAGLIQKAEKPCLVVVNKWDLAEKAQVEGDAAIDDLEFFRDEYEQAIREEAFFMPHVPICFLSAEERTNMAGWVEALREVEEARRTIVPTGELNRLLARAMERQAPPLRGKKRLKIFYATQVKAEVGAPSWILFINDRKLWTPDYARYLETQVRKDFPMPGVPLRWRLKAKGEQR